MCDILLFSNCDLWAIRIKWDKKSEHRVLSFRAERENSWVGCLRIQGISRSARNDRLRKN